jgi:hypothetical protein
MGLYGVLLAQSLPCRPLRCAAAWNFSPVGGVIGVESDPPFAPRSQSVSGIWISEAQRGWSRWKRLAR